MFELAHGANLFLLNSVNIEKLFYMANNSMSELLSGLQITS